MFNTYIVEEVARMKRAEDHKRAALDALLQPVQPTQRSARRTLVRTLLGRLDALRRQLLRPTANAG